MPRPSYSLTAHNSVILFILSPVTWPVTSPQAHEMVSISIGVNLFLWLSLSQNPLSLPELRLLWPTSFSEAPPPKGSIPFPTRATSWGPSAQMCESMEEGISHANPGQMLCVKVSVDTKGRLFLSISLKNLTIKPPFQAPVMSSAFLKI